MNNIIHLPIKHNNSRHYNSPQSYTAEIKSNNNINLNSNSNALTTQEKAQMDKARAISLILLESSISILFCFAIYMSIVLLFGV